MSRTLLDSSPKESLERMVLSARARDRCGLMVWCWILYLLSPPPHLQHSWETRAREHLLHLTIAEILGTSGEFYTRLITMQEDGTCQEARENVSVLECF